jgi:hypothetical protein
MRSDQVTRRQSRTIKAQLQPTLDYLTRLHDRMGRVGFNSEDELMRLVVDAELALHRLCVDLRIRMDDGASRRAADARHIEACVRNPRPAARYSVTLVDPCCPMSYREGNHVAGTMIRPRFSLRMMLSLTAGVACFYYYWFVLPTATARCFVDSISSENYKTADGLFWIASDRTLVQQKEKCWGFQSRAQLLPRTIGQLCSGHRELLLHVSYFQFDQNHDIDMHIAATSFGVNSPAISSTNAARTIDSQVW